MSLELIRQLRNKIERWPDVKRGDNLALVQVIEELDDIERRLYRLEKLEERTRG